MADDIVDNIVDNATGPKRASGDEGSFESHPIGDQIAADRYAKATKASQSRKGPGIRFFKMQAPGASGVDLER